MLIRSSACGDEVNSHPHLPQKESDSANKNLELLLFWSVRTETNGIGWTDFACAHLPNQRQILDFIQQLRAVRILRLMDEDIDTVRNVRNMFYQNPS